MLLTAANDYGRLSGDPRLEHLFRSIPKLPADRQSISELFNAFPETTVLFWHAESGARPVLEALADVKATDAWPPNLIGVVVFRDASFAGLLDRKTSDQAVAGFDLDPRLVHVLSRPIGDVVALEMVNGIQGFAAVLATGNCDFPPFGQLQPANRNDAALTLLIGDALNRATPELGAKLAARAAWQRIGENIRVDLGPAPASEAVSATASTIRKRGQTCADGCSLCGHRGYLRHRATTLKKNEPWHVALPMVRGDADNITALLVAADSAGEEMMDTLLNALMVTSLDDCADMVRSFLRKELSGQCRLQHVAVEQWDIIREKLDRASTKAEFENAVAAVEALLQCEAEQGLRF